MKNLFMITGICLSLAVATACISETSPKRKDAVEQPTGLDTTTLEVNESGYTSYDYYLNWRELAKILYEDQDSVSLAIYRSMVSYIEGIKNSELEMTSKEVFAELGNSLMALRSQQAKTRIDSLLVSVGYNPVYNRPDVQP